MPPRAVLVLILAVYALLGLGYNIVVPVGESPDEPTHLDYVYYLRNHHALPHLSEPGGTGITQGGHPPLYYTLAALLSSWAPPRSPTWVPNPHFTFNLERVMAPNAYVHIHEPPPPYRGAPELLAVHVMRLLSLASIMGMIAAIYALAATVWPHRPCLWWGSAAVAAFVPGVAFMGGVFNNDTLAMLLSALALLGAVRAALGHTGRTDLLLLGVVLGLAVMTKLTAISLIGVAGAGIAIDAWRRRDWRVVARAAVLVGAPLALLGGWWFVRNVRLYGADDPMAWKAFLESGPSLLRTLPLSDELGWYWRHQFRSFWGSFGWTTIKMPEAAYVAYRVLVVAAIAGLALVAGRWRRLTEDARWALALLAVAVVVGYVSVFRLFLDFNMVVAHGRYLYVLLPPVAVLVATGYSALFPTGLRRWALGVLALAMASVSVAALVLVVRPAFALPAPVDRAEVEAAGNPTDAVFDDRFRLVDYFLSSERLTAGQPVTMSLYWQALPENWDPYPSPTEALLGFVHLLGADGEVAARSDQMPFGGAHPTFAWPPGLVYRQDVRLDVDADAEPGAGAILVGWYPENRPADRLSVRVGADGAVGDVFRIEPVVVRPAVPTTVAPSAAPRGDTLGEPPVARLEAYDVEGDVVAGELITVTLYWRALEPVAADHTVFLHVTADDDAPIATGDGPPRGGRYPTSLWEPGELIADPHAIRLPDPLPEGALQLRVGWYGTADGQRLPGRRAAGTPWPDGAIVLERD